MYTAVDLSGYSYFHYTTSPTRAEQWLESTIKFIGQGAEIERITLNKFISPVLQLESILALFNAILSAPFIKQLHVNMGMRRH